MKESLNLIINHSENKGKRYEIVKLETEEMRLNEDYGIRLEIRSEEKLGNILGRTGIIIKKREGSYGGGEDISDYEEKVYNEGILESQEARESKEGYYHYEINLRSHWYQFEGEKHTRWYEEQSFDELLKKFCLKKYLRLYKDLKEPLPREKRFIQYEESDYEFIKRYLSHYGLIAQFLNRKHLYLTDEIGKIKGRRKYDKEEDFNRDTIKEEAIKIKEIALDLRHLKEGKAIGDLENAVIYDYKRITEYQSSHYVFTDFNEDEPNKTYRIETKNETGIPGAGELRVHGLGLYEESYRELLAKKRQKALDALRLRHEWKTNDPNIGIGSLLKMRGGKHYKGEEVYRVIKEQGSYQEGEFKQKLELREAKEAYYVPPIDPPRPSLLRATIQGTGLKGGAVDREGKYRVILEKDELKTTTVPIIAMQALSGKTGGIHFPYEEGTEVLIDFMQGNLQSPYIFGGVTSEKQKSPVTEGNKSQSILQSSGGQALIMDDETKILSLKDREGTQRIEIQGGENPSILIETKGTLRQKAKGNITETGKDKIEEIGGESLKIIEDKIEIKAENYEVEAEEDFQIRAGSIKIEGGTINLRAGTRREQIEGDTYFKAKDIKFQTKEGSIYLEGKGIRIEAKHLIIEQNGGKIEIDEEGRLSVIGKNFIRFQFKTMNFTGKEIHFGGNPLEASLPKVPEFLKIKSHLRRKTYLVSETQGIKGKKIELLPFTNLDFNEKGNEEKNQGENELKNGDGNRNENEDKNGNENENETKTLAIEGGEVISMNGKTLSFPTNTLIIQEDDLETVTENNETGNNEDGKETKKGTGKKTEIEEGDNQITIEQLFPPIIVNLRGGKEGETEEERLNNSYQLKEEEIDYLKNRGGNAFLFIHGFNIAYGDFEKQITDIKLTTVPEEIFREFEESRGREIETQAEKEGKFELIDISYSDEEQTIYRDRETLEKQFPKIKEGDLKERLNEEYPLLTLNGIEMHEWLINMEHNINKATHQFDGSDYSKYQRMVHISWTGNVGAVHYMDSENNATIAGKRLVPVLRQLIEANIKINILAHSMGNRVLLTALDELGKESGNQDQIEHIFIWDASLPSTALSDKISDDKSFRQNCHFINAYKVPKKITVLYSRNDFVLKELYPSGNESYNETELNLEKYQEELKYPSEYYVPLVNFDSEKPKPYPSFIQNQEKSQILPALGSVGADEYTQTLLKDKYIPADLTPWAPSENISDIAGLESHSYMMMPSKDIMIHGYQTFIINKGDWAISFGIYDKSKFPNYPLPSEDDKVKK